jgi:hypothetical protein
VQGLVSQVGLLDLAVGVVRQRILADHDLTRHLKVGHTLCAKGPHLISVHGLVDIKKGHHAFTEHLVGPSDNGSLCEARQLTQYVFNLR